MNNKPKKRSHQQSTDATTNLKTTELLGPDKQYAKFLVFFVALFSLLLLWASFPPLGLWWLGWFAPVPLVWLVCCEQLPSPKPYRELWVAGLFYWLATFYFIPIPHPALFLGWITVSIYLAFYTPMLVAVSRTLVHRFGLPAVIAVPIVWTGIEWIRSVFATGMAMVCLSHTQYQQPVLIQIADLSGAYTLTFAMVIVASGFAIAIMPNLSWLTGSKLKSRIGGAAIAVIAFGLVIGYGMQKLSQPPKKLEPINVAIVQSSIDVVFAEPTDEELTTWFMQYMDLTQEARNKWNDLDLILWPESSLVGVPELISNLDEQRTVEHFASEIKRVWHGVTGYPAYHLTPVPMFVGTTTHDPANDRKFNASLLISDSGLVTQRYFKNHRVMFGEYVPFSNAIPLLQMTPLGKGIAAGTEFETMEIKGVKLAPNICFESTVPHFIRRQVNTLADQQREPDVLINMTNDGWFYGTSCLDLHLACNVFRAVEMRKPTLVAANTGFSAHIGANGELLQVGPRRDTAIIKATVGGVVQSSLYRTIGDTIPMLMGILCLIVLVLPLVKKAENS